MQRFGRLGVCALAAFGVLGAARGAAAQQPSAVEDIDDPKLERRLGTRGDYAPSRSLALSDSAAAGTVAPVPHEGEAAGEAGEAPTFGRDVVVTEVAPTPPGGVVLKHPRLKIGYRRFSFTQIGATPGAVGASEPFNVVSLDWYPVSSTWRFGLSTQYGWEDGTFRQDGDAIVAQTISLGGQIPGDVFTPFFDVYGGGGLMQRMHAFRMSQINSPATAYGELGIDLGTEIFLARHAYLSVAGGYLHSVDGFIQAKKWRTMSGDTLCFKVGFGI